MLLVWTTEPSQLLRLWTGSFDSWKDGAWRLGNSSRLAWARDLQEEGRTEEWYFKNLVWTDICNTIIPRTEAQAQQCCNK